MVSLWLTLACLNLKFPDYWRLLKSVFSGWMQACSGWPALNFIELSLNDAFIHHIYSLRINNKQAFRFIFAFRAQHLDFRRYWPSLLKILQLKMLNPSFKCLPTQSHIALTKEWAFSGIRSWASSRKKTKITYVQLCPDYNESVCSKLKCAYAQFPTVFHRKKDTLWPSNPYSCNFDIKKHDLLWSKRHWNQQIPRSSN